MCAHSLSTFPFPHLLVSARAKNFRSRGICIRLSRFKYQSPAQMYEQSQSEKHSIFPRDDASPRSHTRTTSAAKGGRETVQNKSRRTAIARNIDTSTNARRKIYRFRRRRSAANFTQSFIFHSISLSKRSERQIDDVCMSDAPILRGEHTSFPLARRRAGERQH